MTCGIYKLSFNGTDKVYIGQSTRMEVRYTQHKTDMRKGRASEKMQEAYTLYGLPQLEILKVCNSVELDTYETEYIAKYNSVDSGFNTYRDPYEAPVKKGTQAGNSKYSEDLIIDALMYLTIPNSTIQKASIEFNVGVPALRGIVYQGAHTWVSEKYPQLLENIRSVLIQSTQNSRVKAPKLNYCLKEKIGRPVYVVDPNGIIHEVTNINEFSKNHDISKSSLHRLISKQVSKTKGWVLCLDVQA